MTMKLKLVIILCSLRLVGIRQKRKDVLTLKKTFLFAFGWCKSNSRRRKIRSDFIFREGNSAHKATTKSRSSKTTDSLTFFLLLNCYFFFDEMDDWHVSRMLWLGSSAVEEMEILLSHKTDPKLQHKRARDVFMACENECRLCAKWSSGRSWICWIMVIATFIYSLAPAQPIIFCNNNLH